MPSRRDQAAPKAVGQRGARVTREHSQPVDMTALSSPPKAVPQENTRSTADKPLLSLDNVMHSGAYGV